VADRNTCSEAKGAVLIQLPDGSKVHSVITSFNEAGFKRYGKDFIESFLECWPKTAHLTVYYEGEDFPYTGGMSWVPIEKVEHLPEYLGNLRFPIMQGIVGDKFDMWFDARQARKSFMEMHHLKTTGGKVFWLDADTVTHSKVPETFLDDMLPDDKFCCYLGRDGWYHTESGFLGFNADHPLTERFYNNYLNVFLSGAIFASNFHGRPGWNDCCGFDGVRHVLGNGPEFVDLAKSLPKGTMHPFVNSVLGKYMDHRKGPRKESRSTEKDLVIERDEPYWKA
jgi:hypothetical protein